MLVGCECLNAARVWSKASLAEFLGHGTHGRIDDVERVFFTLLTGFASIHEALASYAECIGADVWKQELDSERDTDRLLLYLWKARDADIHDAIIKWAPGLRALGMKVVDKSKLVPIARQFYVQQATGDQMMRAFKYLFEVNSDSELISKVGSGFVPSNERLASAGVALTYAIDEIALKSFTCRVKGKTILIGEPTSHLGRTGLSSSAYLASKAAIEYYEAKVSRKNNLIKFH